MILILVTHALAIAGMTVASTVPLLLLLIHALRNGPPAPQMSGPLAIFMLGTLGALVLADIALWSSLGWWFLALGFPGGVSAALLVEGLLRIEDALALRRYEREQHAR